MGNDASKTKCDGYSTQQTAQHSFILSSPTMPLGIVLLVNTLVPCLHGKYSGKNAVNPMWELGVLPSDSEACGRRRLQNPYHCPSSCRFSGRRFLVTFIAAHPGLDSGGAISAGVLPLSGAGRLFKHFSRPRLPPRRQPSADRPIVQDRANRPRVYEYMDCSMTGAGQA